MIAFQKGQPWRLAGRNAPLRSIYQSCRGCAYLQTPMVAASAKWPPGINRHMSGFTAHSGCSVPDLTIEDDSVPHSRTQCQHAQRPDAELLSLAKRVLGKRRDIGVALNGYRRVEPLFHLREQVEPVPTRQIGRAVKKSRGEFQRSRRSNANAGERVTFRVLV